MKTRTLIAGVFGTLAALFGVGGAYAVSTLCPEDPEIVGTRLKSEERNRSEEERAQLRESLAQSEREWRQRCLSVIFMTEEKKVRIREEKRADHNRATLEFAELEKKESPKSVEENPFVGIFVAAHSPMPPFNYKKFLTINYWGGKVGGMTIGVYAGALPEDPLQGIVLVADKYTGVSAISYPIPTATGPVEIVSEENGILTLRSIAGTYEKRDAGDGTLLGTVIAPGGAVYYFNVHTRMFQ